MSNPVLSQFIEKLTQAPQSIRFEDSMSVIDALYDFTPSAFRNGQQQNAAGENSGSCKIFAFAKQQGLNEQQTLALFGQYYQDVLNTPDGNDHQNIRQFMHNGWAELEFSQAALSDK